MYRNVFIIVTVEHWQFQEMQKNKTKNALKKIKARFNFWDAYPFAIFAIVKTWLKKKL